jgi:hypothetical protein
MAPDRGAGGRAASGLGGLSSDFFAWNSRHLLSILAWFLKSPAKIGLTYHKTVIGTFLRMIASVKRAEPVDEHVAALQRNLDDYVKGAAEFCKRVREEIPAGPFGDGTPIGVVLLAPLIKSDRRLAVDYNSCLDTYQKVLEVALDGASAYAKEGENIEAETRERVGDLRREVDQLAESWKVDIVLKDELRKKLDWLDFDLMSRVQSARSAAQDTARNLQNRLGAVSRYERL